MTRKHHTKLSKRQAVLLYRKYRAVLILTNNLSPDERIKIDDALEHLEKVDEAEYINDIQKKTIPLRDIAKTLFDHYGVIGTFEQIEKVGKATPEKNGDIVYVAKFHLEKIFDHYERVIPVFTELPPYARIGIPVSSATSIKGQVEVFILEASLFEDMAILWNSVLELNNLLILEYNKEQRKLMRALARATIKAAYNFIEGYLNSLALDILITQHTNEKDEILLTEWDKLAERPKFLTLRDKLLQYPKIAVGASVPLLQESNCPEIKKIIEWEKELRHSLIHPNPQSSLKDVSFNREQMYQNINIDEASQICDLTIALIQKIDNAIDHKFGNINLWLGARETTGFFPKELFF